MDKSFFENASTSSKINSIHPSVSIGSSCSTTSEIDSFIQSNNPFADLEVENHFFESTKEERASFLEKTIKETPNLSGKTDHKLFSILHLDAIIANTEFEGGSVFENAKFLQEIAISCQDKTIQAALQSWSESDLECVKNHSPQDCSPQGINDFSNLMHHKLKNLENGQSLLIPAGYTNENTSGHTMLIRFTKNADGSFQMVVLNTGEGINFHNHLQSGDKKKISPALVYDNIPVKLLSNSFFFSVLSKKFIPKSGSDYDVKTIYKALFNRFEKYKVLFHPLAQITITPQRGGSCSMKVLLATLRLHLKDTALYKRAIIYIKKMSLIKFYQENQDSLTENKKSNAQIRHLLKSASESLARKTAKGLRQNCLSQEEARETLLLTTAILEKLEESEKKLKELKKANVKNGIPTCTPIGFTSFAPSEVPSIVSQSEDISTTQILTFQTPENAAQLKANIDACLQRAKELVETFTIEAAKTQVEILTNTLFPFPTVYNESEIGPIVHSLVLLQDFYTSFFENQDCFCLANERNVLLTLYTFIVFLTDQHPIARRLIPALFPTQSLLKQLDNQREIFFSPADYQKRFDLIAYLSNMTAKYALYKSDPSNEIHKTTLITQDDFSNPSTEAKEFYNFIQSTYEEKIIPYFNTRNNRTFTWNDNVMSPQISILTELFSDVGENANSVYNELDLSCIPDYKRSTLLIQSVLYSKEFNLPVQQNRCRLSFNINTDHSDYYDVTLNTRSNDTDLNRYSKFSSAYSFNYGEETILQCSVSNENSKTHKALSGFTNTPEGQTLIAISEPSLSLFNLLSFYEKSIHFLENDEHRHFFLQQFFKASISLKNGSSGDLLEEHTLHPPIDLNGEAEQLFRTPFLNFIRSGFSLFCDATDNTQLETLLFFIQIASMTAHYTKDKELGKRLESEINTKLDSLLSNKTLSKETKLKIHLIRLFFFALAPLKSSDTKKIVESAFNLMQAKALPYSIDQYLVRIATQFIYKTFSDKVFLNEISNDPTFLNDILISLDLFIDPKSGAWESSEEQKTVFHFYTHEPHQKLWSLNLLNGSLLNHQTGALSFYFDESDIYANANFRELSGGKSLKMKRDRQNNFDVTLESGETISFALREENYLTVNHSLKKLLSGKVFTFHTEGDYIYCVSDGKEIFFHKDNKDQFRLKCRPPLEGNEEILFLPKSSYADDLKSLNIPHSILSDHHLFKLSQDSSKIIILDKDFNPAYIYDEDGLFRICVTEKGNIIKIARISTPNFQSPFFEDPKYTFFEETNGKTILTFSRFTNQGKALRFIENEKGDFVFEGDTRYALAKDVPTLFGRLKSFLLLNPLSPEENLDPIALFPNIDYNYKKSSFPDFIDGAKLDIYDENSKKTPLERLSSPQDLTRTFFAIPIKNGELSPLNVEQSLFAAYLFIGQRNYTNAFACLKEITPFDLQKKERIDLLKRILTLSKEMNDSSIDAITLFLKAQSLHLDKDALKEEGFQKRLKSNYNTYVSQSARKKEELTLSLDEIKRLSDFLEIKASARSGFYEPQNVLEKESHSIYSPHIHLYYPNEAYDEPTIEVAKELDSLFDQNLLFSLHTSLHLIFRKLYLIVTHTNELREDQKEELRYIFQNALEGSFQKADSLILFLALLFEEVQKKPELAPFAIYKEWEKSNPNENCSVWGSEALNYYGINRRIPFSFDQPLISFHTGPSLENPSPEKYNHEITDTFPLKLAPSNLDPILQDLKERLESDHNAAKIEKAQHFKNTLEEKFQRDQSAIKTSFDDFIAGLDNHIEILKKKQIYDSSIDIKALDDSIEQAENELKTKKLACRKLANKHNLDERSKLERQLLVNAKSRKIIGFSDLVHLFVHRQEAFYKNENEALTNADIQYLINLTGDTLRLEIQLRHIKAIREAAFQNNKEKLAALIQEGTDPKAYIDNPKLLAFEYTSGLRFRKEPDQVNAITHMTQKETDSSYKNTVDLVPMGGGKTSVLIANLLAESEGIPILITPSFQFQTVYESVKTTLKKCFNIDLVAFNYTREELTLPVLENMYNTFKEIAENKGKRSKKAVIVCPELLQILELDFVSLLKTPGTSERKTVLSKILTLLKSEGNGIGDEVQTLFNINKEVNFSLGSPKSVRKEHIDLLKEIFLLLEEPEIEGQLHLKENRQGYFPEEVLRDEIIPKIALALAKNYAPLELSEDLQEKFVLFVQNKLSPDDPFMQALHNQERSPLSKNLLCLAKHLLFEILPSTLSKSANLRYMRTKNPARPGEVAPCLAAGTEAHTKFAYHYELAAYHLALALYEGFQEKQIRHIQKNYHKEALFFVKTLHIPYETTKPALDCKKLLGCLPNEPLNLENKSFTTEEILEIEAATMDEYVKYYPYRVTSNAHTLFHTLRSFRATGGTIDPFVLPLQMQENQDIDPSINPRILEKLFSTCHENTVTSLPSLPLEETFRHLIETHPQKERVSAILDAGGLFKDYDIDLLGPSLHKVLQEIDHPVKNVVFYCKANGSLTADYFALLKDGDTTPTILKDTSEEELAKYGLKPGNYITLYDNRHCLGTDIKQPKDGIGIVLYDKGVTTDLLCQTIMRFRQFLEDQEICIAVKEEVATKLDLSKSPKESLSALFFDINSTQANERASDMYKTYRKALSDTLYQKGLTEILAAEEDAVKVDQLVLAFEASLFCETEDLPYESFSHLETKDKAVESLASYSTKLLENLENRLKSHLEESETAAILSDCKSKHEKILAKAEETRKRMIEEVTVPANDKGGELEVTCLTETAQELNMQLEMELQNELTQHQNKQGYLPPVKYQLKEASVLDFIDKKDGTLIRDLLNRPIYNGRFQNLFTSNLQLSKPCQDPYREEISLLHYKMPPLNHLFYIVDDHSKKKKGVLLSEQEAAICENALNNFYAGYGSAWLIQLDSTLEAGASDEDYCPDKNDPEFKHILLEANILAGSVDYLMQHPREFYNWMYHDLSLTKEKQDYLKLKIEHAFPEKKEMAYKYLLDKKALEEFISRLN